MSGREISTLDEFQSLLQKGLGAIVITDNAAPPVAHRVTGCSWLTSESFMRKVIAGGGKNGLYSGDRTPFVGPLVMRVGLSQSLQPAA